MSWWMCQSCHSLQGFSQSMKCFACEGPLEFATMSDKPEVGEAAVLVPAPPEPLSLRGLKTALQLLRGTLVSFHEGKQEFFCRVCRYRDPLGPAGTKLHDDNCPLLVVETEFEAIELRAASAVSPPPDPWQLEHTAPEKTLVLALWTYAANPPYYAVANCGRSEATNRPVPRGPRCWYINGSQMDTPTHWMPLPQSPIVAASPVSARSRE